MKNRIQLLLILLLLPTVAPAQEFLYKAAVLAEGLIKAYQAATITDEDMAAYMAESMKQMDRQNTVCSSSSAYAQRLKRLTKGMTEVEGVPLNFKVYQKNEANAFASPDGSVRVFSKLMDIMTDEELLGIIGHELGHVAHSDSRREYQAALLASAARDGLSLSDGNIGAIARSSLGDIGELLLNNKYSRTQEAAADDYGYDYLVSHGVNPWAMAKAFEKLKSMQERSTSTLAQYAKYAEHLLSTHPDLDQRIQTMSERATHDGYRRP